MQPPYRSDLAAAHARIAELEAENACLREAPLSNALAEVQALETALRQALGRKGRRPRRRAILVSFSVIFFYLAIASWAVAEHEVSPVFAVILATVMSLSVGIAWIEATRRTRERVHDLELRLVGARRIVEIERAAAQPAESRLRVGALDDDSTDLPDVEAGDERAGRHAL